LPGSDLRPVRQAHIEVLPNGGNKSRPFLCELRSAFGLMRECHQLLSNELIDGAEVPLDALVALHDCIQIFSNLIRRYIPPSAATFHPTLKSSQLTGSEQL